MSELITLVIILVIVMAGVYYYWTASNIETFSGPTSELDKLIKQIHASQVQALPN